MVEYDSKHPLLPGKKSRTGQPVLPCPTEDVEQESVIRYLSLAYPKARVIHIANEGKRGWNAQRMLKKLGVMKGASDLLIYDWRSPRILHLEMKRVRGSKVSPEQIEWQEWLTAHGYQSVLCKGFDPAKAAIDLFFSGE